MRKSLTTLAALIVLAVGSAPALAQDQDPALKKALQELEDIKKRLGLLEGDPNSVTHQDPDEIKRKAGQVYSKPFLKRFGRNVYLGGYIDLEFVGAEASNDDTFDQHRLVPFIYADVSESIKVATEIEIEHGGELGVEFGHLDWWLSEAVNFRAGIILDPLGKLNLVHDGPFQDLTLRPLVDEWIIPAVLREPGVGFFGTADLDPWKVDYEIYLVNGFKGLSKTGTTVISKSAGLRNARPHLAALGTRAYRDFNDNKAVVGRLAVSPFLGLEIGGSFHTGTYDERSDNGLTILAVDWTISGGGLYNKLLGGAGTLRDVFFAVEIVGEWVRADLERDAFAQTAGVPGDLSGYFVELRYHFMFESWKKAIPGATDEATFTLIVRWDDTDLDGAKRDRLTFGLNFRPQEQTVVKAEITRAGESGDAADVDNDQVVFSIATYF